MRGIDGLWGGLALAALTGMACSPAGSDGGADDTSSAQTSSSLSYVGQNVVKTLSETQNLRPLQGRTWEVTTTGNTLESQWLLPTFGSEWWGDKLTSLPVATSCTDGEARCDPDFHMRTCDASTPCASGTCVPFTPSIKADGQAATRMCVGYGDWFEQALYDAIVSAEHQVDISSLWLPADRFTPAIRNGLARLAARGKPVVVRILSGDASDIGPLASRSTAKSLAEITKGLPAGSPLKIYVAEESAGLLSWNHSKIIAADGKFALVGGHNMHTADYQLKDPVSDLSMRLTGAAAASAHRYLNEVWDVGCKRGTLHGFGLVTYPAGGSCPPHYDPPKTAATEGSGGPVPAVGSTPVIAVGRLGGVPDNASDAALLAMVDSAKQSIVMSQEDVLGGRIPKTNWSVAGAPTGLLQRLAVAIGRGVDVYLVISNVDGGLFTTSYSHGWSTEETVERMADIMKDKKLFPPDADLTALLCDKLHVAGLRLSDNERWADGKVFSNHSKFLMIDTQAFYVGSQNLYVSDLAEFGYIVDSADAARVVRSTFWEPLWKYSQRAAVSGSGAKCSLRK